MADMADLAVVHCVHDDDEFYHGEQPSPEQEGKNLTARRLLLEGSELVDKLLDSFFFDGVVQGDSSEELLFPIRNWLHQVRAVTVEEV